MGIKAAKEAFSKDDIIEILKRNVALYREEQEFVEYIVTLALYLLDQHYGPEYAGEIEFPLPPGFGKKLEAAVGEQIAENPDLDEAGLIGPTPVFRDLGSDPIQSMDLPPTAKERALREQHKEDPPSRFRPPRDPRETDEDMPPSPRDLKSSREVAKLKEEDLQEDGEGEAPGPEGERARRKKSGRVPSSRFDQESTPLILRSKTGIIKLPGKEVQGEDRDKEKDEESTKEKEGHEFTARSSIDSVDIRNSGKMRVYRIVRSRSSSEKKDSPCPICGTDTLGAKQCPTCGHIMY